MKKNVTIIGGGPSALMLAAQLDGEKYQVTLYEKKKTVGRKFLVAGEGGLNLTFNSPLDKFINQYFPAEFMDLVIRQFSNKEFMAWLNDKGISTFVGSSNRVFPVLELKPIEVLNTIVDYIVSKGVEFKLGHQWLAWDTEGVLIFDENKKVESDIVVFALGGASWKVTGSDGGWAKTFEDQGIKVKSFRAANCAFGVDWDKKFIAVHEGKPLKNIALTFDSLYSKGELTISKFGLEGNAIYALSQKIQDSLMTEKGVVIFLDLKPTMSIDEIKAKYNSSRLTKVTDILREDVKLDRSSIAIIKQFTDKDTFLNPDKLAETIKAVPITIQAADDIDRAISTLGGIDLNELDKHFQFKKIPNAYAIGEMLDWYAPTGGYLLQACFSMGYVLAEYLNEL